VTDPATRERRARDELLRLAAEVNGWAAERRAALWDLKRQHGTWKKVADATGQTVPAITKAAYKKAKEGTTP
jgi:hypothetical protein